MSGARVIALVALSLAGSAGCGLVVGYPGAVPPAHTQTYASLTAPALPSGVDPMAGLQHRPMRPPAMPSNGTCFASSTNALAGSVAPNYGAGVGPVYLSGQNAWYAGGEVAILMVDAQYTGPLVVRPFAMGGSGQSPVTFDVGTEPDLFSPDSAAAAKEKQHGVIVVPATPTAGGGFYLAPTAQASYWRAAFGRLSSAGPGCFGFQIDGDNFTEFIVVEVNAGAAPPG